MILFSRRRAFWLSGIALVAAAAPAAIAAAPFQADTPVTTAAGTSFTAPRAWARRDAGGAVILDPPEAGSHVAVIDVAEAADAKAAVAAAWRAYRPEANRPLRLIAPRAARNGWDEQDLADYESSPNEHVAVQAVAFRKGKAWTVMITDANSGIAEKRGAAIGLITQSIRPAGYAPETFAGKTARPLDAAAIAAMRAFVEQSIAELGVPGAGFALIDHGKVVYEGGAGVKELGKPAPVDARTLFMVASNTKGMSTLLLSELVDEGKLKWDEPVTQAYPAFRLGNDATTKSVLIKHLVCACTGLPRKDYDWIFATSRTTPATVTFDQLAASQPTSGFGEVYQYNNLMASAAGYIGGHIIHPDRELGAAYDAAMAERIFGPLGMSDTTFSMGQALAGNYASPHGDDFDGKPGVGRIDFEYVMVPYRPAGGAWSSAHDMIKYVGLELTQGVLPNGKRLVSAENLLARRKRGVPAGENQWYGMGLQEDASSGVSVIHHGGSMAGYKTDILFVPSADVGAVILTNADNGQQLLQPFRRRLLEILYDGRPEAAGDVAAAAAQIKARNAKEREQWTAPPSPADSALLAGAYASPDLGPLQVLHEGPNLRFRFSAWSSLMATRHNPDGTVSFLTIDPTSLHFEFVVGEKDGRKLLTIRDRQHDYVFTEVGGA